MSLILFGGTFDPIHRGHIQIAKEVKEKVSASKVILIPSKNPRWKTPIDINDRLNMLNLSIKGDDDFLVSRFEIDSDAPVNYSIDTVRYFKNLYKNETPYFLIGFDQVYKLDRWKDIDEISSLVQLIAVSRPSCPTNHPSIKKYNIKVINCREYDISSTDIREFKSLDVNEEVLHYIIDHKLYFYDTVKAFYSDKRFQHVLSVAWLSYDIAKENGLDPTIAFIAGILHDVGKESENQEEVMKLYYKEYLDYPPVVFHQFVGEYIAKNFFKINDERVLEAIKYHTTGNRSMGKYAKIIYAADKIDPTRGYDSKEMIKAMKENLSSGFKMVLNENFKFLSGKKNVLFNNKLSKLCISYYLKEEYE